MNKPVKSKVEQEQVTDILIKANDYLHKGNEETDLNKKIDSNC